MRTVLIAFLAAAILTGCQTGSTSSVTPLPERSPIPRAVLRLADAYIDSLAGQQRQDRDAIREDFSRNFFEGFTMPGAAMSPNLTAAGAQGLFEGRKYRLLTNPARIKETMEGYGCISTKVEGTWIGQHFEDICFRPSSQPTQRWDLLYLGDTKAHAYVSDHLKINQLPKEGVRVRIEGYWSPRGNSDPIGGCDHYFYATSISKIGG